MSSIHYERGIKDLFDTLGLVSRYHDIDQKIFPNGVYRIDVKLLYGLYARFIIDPVKRVDTIYMMGLFKGGKFKSIFHYDFPIDFEKLHDARKAANELEKILDKRTEEYRYRLRKIR